MRDIAKSTSKGLTPRQRQVLGLLAVGLDMPSKEHPDIPVGRPLGPKQIRKVLNCPYSYITGLMGDPTFKLELARATQLIRGSYAPAVMARIGEIALESEDETKAIAAGKVILGEDTKGPAVQVNVGVQTNVSANVRAGYRFEPCDRPAAAKIIDGTAD